MRYELSNPIYWKVSEVAPVWMGVCDVLGLTVVADTQEDLIQEVSRASHEYFKDLYDDGQLEAFLQEKGLKFHITYNGEVEQYEGVGVTLVCRKFPSAEDKLERLTNRINRILDHEDQDLDVRATLRALLATVED